MTRKEYFMKKQKIEVEWKLEIETEAVTLKSLRHFCHQLIEVYQFLYLFTAGQSATKQNVGVGSAIAIIFFIVGALSMHYCCSLLCCSAQEKKSENYYITPPLPPRLQQQAKEVEYEEVSVVVADGEHHSIELTSAATGLKGALCDNHNSQC